MYKIINVVFTNRKLNAVEISKLSQYSFICNEKVKEGDLLVSPNYTTGMMVTKIFTSESNLINGRTPIKELIIDTINGKPTVKNIINDAFNETFQKHNTMNNTKSNSMFNGIVDKYKSQFIPEKEEGVRMSLSGLICVPVGDEYIGMDNEGNLTSFPVEMTIDIPVYSILKLNSDVKVGDIIKTAKSYSKVIGKNDDGLKILSFSGYTHNKKEVKDFLMNQATTRVLINMFNFDDSNGFNPIFFAMASGDNLDVNSLMMLSMTPQGKNLFSNAGGSFNPMMLMMFDKNNNQGGSMMETMCMMQMMGGNNMFGNMFSNISKPETSSEDPKLIETPSEDDELAKLNRQIEIEQKKAKLAELIKSNTAANCPSIMLKNIREAVRKAGGCIDGNFRFSIMWNDEETKAIVDLDAHAKQPDGQEIYYARYKKPSMTSISGQLDVDMINPADIGIENIYWTDLDKLQDGVYKFFIHNYNGGKNQGCNAELFFKGKLWQYAIPHEIKHSKDEVVAVVTLKDRKIVNVKHCPYLVEEMDLITRFK